MIMNSFVGKVITSINIAMGTMIIHQTIRKRMAKDVCRVIKMYLKSSVMSRITNTAVNTANFVVYLVTS